MLEILRREKCRYSMENDKSGSKKKEEKLSDEASE
jgi:hypothetical protein